jgi:alpha-glucuronidase
MTVKTRIALITCCLLFICAQATLADDGYRLWLKYNRITDTNKLNAYRAAIKGWTIPGTSPTLQAASLELQLALEGLLGIKPAAAGDINAGNIVAGISLSAAPTLAAQLNLQEKLKNVSPEGFVIYATTIKNKKAIIIGARQDIGVLYGVFHFLRLLQTGQSLEKLSIESSPKIKLRILNHWDNLDRTVERGYAGFSLWDWHKLPDYIDPRYTDYARANASIGINGTVLTNVNANALILRADYLQKVAALANLFRPYGIRVYLTARFSAPMEAGGLKTADPLDPEVQAWWKSKVAEIYKVIPDFGGFLVKANSEGQPGPQNYKRSHADGANMLADAVAPYNGIVMWRAFVYDNNVPDDRAKQAYNEFKPLDGTFRPNVLVQVKNGAIDFQPREPFHPLFGAMPKTPLMMEFQITQEYLGFSTHLVFLPALFNECLAANTHNAGNQYTVAQIVDGTAGAHALTGIAGVANIGNDRNWCGHPFAQANWYGFGRQAWDHTIAPATIAEEWTRMTLTNDNSAVAAIRSMMLASREAVVNYMTPLGLHHIMGWNHHYGPGPWIKDKPRADWTSVYYHQADEQGVGFNRTATGSRALEQYAPLAQKVWESPDRCPETHLLWFHHLPWTHTMKSGRTLWDELCFKYQEGVDTVRWMQTTWQGVKSKVDAEQFAHVTQLLNIQQQEAVWWRNACLLYFQSFSKKPIPAGVQQPEHNLEYYEKLSFPYAPGIRPGW